MKTYQDVLNDALTEGSKTVGEDLHALFKQLLDSGEILPPPLALSTLVSDEHYVQMKESFGRVMQQIAELRKTSVTVVIIRKPFDYSRN